MNYTQLATAIQDYTQNYETEFVDNIPTFVEQAEQRIYNNVQLPALRKNVTGNCTSGNKYLACPDDYLASYSLAVVDGDGNYEYLLNKDVNFIRAAYPSVAASDYGLPRYYGLFGSQYTLTNELSFILGPTPDDSYDVELHYFYYPVSIVQGAITLGTITAGSAYTNGTYSNVPLTGGNGSGATANITVSGNLNVESLSANLYINANGNITGGNLTSSGTLTTVYNESATGNIVPSANLTYNIGSTSAWWNNIYGTSIHAQYADLAERFESDIAYAPGTVVELGGVAEVTQVQDDLSDKVFGVISTRAAYLMNSSAGDDKTHPAVAMTGRVPVKVSGVIKKGQALVTTADGNAIASENGNVFAMAFCISIHCYGTRDKTDEKNHRLKEIIY